MHQSYQIEQTALVFAINAELTRQHPGMLASSSIFNAVIRAANDVVAECAREPVKAVKGMSIPQWFGCDDTGLSSKFMAYILGDCQISLPFQDYSFPYDCDDFGRCVRMVEATGSEKLVYLMLPTGKEWRYIATHWETMVELYHGTKDEDSEALYEMLQRARA
ncbi:hypothetical protein NTE19_003401 [Vibrio fluvialis]|nr:hypothetical protein [Vibrio fluvialis]